MDVSVCIQLLRTDNTRLFLDTMKEFHRKNGLLQYNTPTLDVLRIALPLTISRYISNHARFVVFKCKFVFIASQHTLNQLRLQQYTPLFIPAPSTVCCGALPASHAQVSAGRCSGGGEGRARVYFPCGVLSTWVSPWLAVRPALHLSAMDDEGVASRVRARSHRKASTLGGRRNTVHSSGMRARASVHRNSVGASSVPRFVVLPQPMPAVGVHMRFSMPHNAALGPCMHQSRS